MENPSGPSRRAPALRRDDGWLIGRVANTPIVLARSWFVIGLIAIAVFAPIASQSFPDSNTAVVIAAIAFVFILLIAVLAHEIGHTLAAITSGHKVHKVVITAWGGHTSFSSANAKPLPSLFIALVGPAVNLVLAALFKYGYDSVSSAAVDDRGVLLALILNAGVVVNGLMGVFNLLPIMPLDGARALEAVVWRIVHDRDRATVIVAWIGRVLIVIGVVVLLAVMVTQRARLTFNVPLVLLFAWVGWRSSGTVLQQVRQQKKINSLSLAGLMRPAQTLDRHCSVAVVAAEMARTNTALVVLTSFENQAIAYVEGNVVAQVPEHNREHTPASGVWVSLPEHQPLQWELHGGELLEEIRARSQVTPVVVIADSARIIGLLWVRDVVLALK